METIVKEYQVYSFDELSEDAKEKAIYNLYDINVDYSWWDFTYLDAERIGLKITGFDLARNRHASGKFLLSPNEVAQNILNEHGESCETYKTAKSFMDEFEPIFTDYLDESSEDYESSDLEDQLTDLESEFLNSLLEDYSIILENEYEYLTSEESIIETLKANDYQFLEDGKLF